MPSATVPYLLTILTGSVGGGLIWTPDDDYVATGAAWNLRVGAHFSTPKLELELALSGLEGETREIPYPFSAEYVHMDALIPYLDTELFDPYVAVGVGWRSLDVSSETRNGLTGAEALSYIVLPSTDALVSAGLGARLAIWGPLALRADVHATLVAGGQPAHRPNELIPGFDASLAAHFRYDGPPDRDKDGVPNTVDQCRDEPEDHDYFDDKDGCIDPDDDNDGIPDTLDACKDAAEDKDGFEDENGCPDQNNDRDPFPDTMDQCPLAAEVQNGWEDGDGCPDAVPLDLLAIAGIRREISFDGTTLGPSSEAILTSVKAALEAHPEAKIEMRVFWDGAEGATVAHDRARAHAVALYRWFEAHGLPNDRILYKVSGDIRPLASDATPEGAATNRRVEVMLVDPVSGDGKSLDFTVRPPEEWPP